MWRCAEKYTDSKLLYEKAFTYKPLKEYPKTEIEKIKFKA
jgi:hypothetical protein